jgi:uncharacterized protein YdeI (YjbR/CyaY-like superfamily)
VSPPKAQFFASPDAFRAWLAAHHQTKGEIVVGFYKVSSGKPTITWPQAIEEAIAFGWIDGIRRSIDHESYSNRFTPRRPSSNWSLINIATARRLIREGRMAPSGLAAFKRRKPDKTAVYAAEQYRAPKLAPAEARAFRAQKNAWTWFKAAAPSYQRNATWWVVSAKKPETRTRRLQQLIASSRAGKRVPPLTPPAKR